MSNSGSSNLLLIGAYRNDEVSSSHPLNSTVDKIREAGIFVNTIALLPLTKSDVNHLIADTFNYTSEQAQPLSQLIYRKTKGNPFFTTQFLKSLHEDGLITFNVQLGQWQANLEEINILSQDQDVVEFMRLQLLKLPESTQNALKLAACIGNLFALATLSVIYQRSQQDTAAHLWDALQEGYLLTDDAGCSGQSPTYKFFHDRVQQAAYSLIPEEAKQTTHLLIGQLLLQQSPEDKRETNLFEIVNHLNLGASLMCNPTERHKLAQLNLQAGCKAIAAAAYSAASSYFEAGISLLPVDAWERDYELTLMLYSEAVEATYLSGGDLDRMEQLAEQTLQHAKTLLDQVRVYEVKIQANISQNRLSEALSLALSVLSLLGIDLPESVTAADVEQGLQYVQAKLADRTVDELTHLPLMQRPIHLAAMRILATLISITFVTAPPLLPLVICELVSLSLQEGHSAWSAFAYANYGLLLSVRGDTAAGHCFGQLAIQLVERFNARSIQAKTFTIVYGMTIHWQQPLATTLDPLIKGYQIGVETGDFEYASYCLLHRNEYAYFCGHELGQLTEQLAIASEGLTQTNQMNSLAYNEIYRQTVLNLTECPENPICLSGAAYDEIRSLPLHQQADDRYAIYQVYLNKLILSYLFGDFQQAVDYADLAELFINGVSGLYFVPVFYFYDSLARLAVYATASDQQAVLAKVQQNQRKLRQWAEAMPDNFLHKVHLVEAEQCRVLNQFAEAIAHYDSAIALATTYHYRQEEALANELAGKFYLNWGKVRVAQVYLTDACYAYALWGAKTKVSHLEQAYPFVLQNPATSTENNCQGIRSTTSSLSLSSDSLKVLDLTTVLKASQSISSDIQLDQVLANLMKVLLENAGAQKSVLLLRQEGQWEVAVQAGDDLELTLQIPKGQSLSVEQVMPQSMLNYVAHTAETLVIDTAGSEPPFSNDAYILTQQPKSILCMPIHHRGELIGILYLENNLSSRAFTSDRVEVLQLLATQAAISLQNALLYNTLEQKVEQRTQELYEKNHHLSQALTELQQTQAQLIQSEKMSSLGQVVAGVAHEINNPASFICGNITHAKNYFQDLLDLVYLYQTHHPQTVPQIEDKLDEMNFDFLRHDVEKLMTSMQSGIDRIRQIVISLRNFSRLNEADMKPVDLNQGLESTLLILQHRLNSNHLRINLKKEYGELPQVMCYASQINQVFMNILNNAIDALEEKEQGSALTLCIRTEVTPCNKVKIWISDNGNGMSQTVQQRLFDPFFTTKPIGKGTGLGLSVCYAIVKKHNGQLEFTSKLGQGTEFAISIPLLQ
jgi:predicted ATPase/signal transduction histidine kinase